MKLTTGAERITALTMLALCVGLVLAGHQSLYWDGYAPASGFAPIWVGIAGIILAALLLFQIGTGGHANNSSLPSRPELFRVVATVVALWVFVGITPWLGMIPAAFLLMLFMLIAVLRRPPPISIATAIGTSLLVYAIFVAWLKVPLPKGLFGI
jgi:putative tricarboxylic transport membrane protein